MLATFLYKTHDKHNIDFIKRDRRLVHLVDSVIIVTAYLSASCSLYKSLQATAAPPETRDVHKNTPAD